MNGNLPRFSWLVGLHGEICGDPNAPSGRAELPMEGVVSREWLQANTP